MGEYKVIWLKRARQDFLRHLIYAQMEFGSKAFQHWVEQVRETESMIRENPRRFPLVHQLRHRIHEYRGRIIMRNFKLVYSCDEKRHIVKIRTIWDMRMNPETLIRTIR
jgi:plasmid stabilization system protein ParE